MTSLSTVIAAAVSCSVLFIVSAVIGVIVWVRLRQERLSLAVANATQRRFALGSQHFPADTLTELSHEEGTALRQYGQLPYGGPTEWGALASQDNLITHAAQTESKPQLIDRARSLRKSLSITRPKSKRRSKRLQKHNRLNSAGTLADSSNQLGPPDAPYSKEGAPVSAVEGVMELPTETTPRQTPERDEGRPSLDLNMRPISSAWPTIPQRTQTGLCPVFEDRAEFKSPPTRVRGGSITAQSPGAVPTQPAPPPPVAYPPNRFTLTRDDSVMRLSSLSLDTADSSILDDSMEPSAMDSDMASPSLPPCPTFTPYSADDVGKSYSRNPATSKTSLLPTAAFATNSTLSGSFSIEPPRRSQTARSPSCSTENATPPPRRSESLYTNPVGRGSRLESHPNPIRRESSLLPHFSQMRPNWPGVNLPFRGGPEHRSSINSHDIPSRQASFVQDTPQQTPEHHRRTPLYSALKGRNGSRKGHRRQNCVRISIHPPVKFEGSGFPPTFEEAEEQEEPNKDGSQTFNLSTSNLPSPTEISPISINTPTSSREATVFRDPHYSPRTPTKKRKHERTDSDVFSSEKSKNLPNIFTSLPLGDSAMSSTPSPAKDLPMLPLSSPTSTPTHENFAMGSPRRSTVKGPRSQPGKKLSNVHRSPAALAESVESTPLGSPSRHSRAVGSRKSTDSQQQLQGCAPTQLTSPPRNDRRPGTERSHRQSTATSTPPSSKKASNAQDESRVSIWEDRKHERTPSKKSPSAQGTVRGTVMELEKLSPRKIERSKSMARSKKSPQRTSRQASRLDFVTPTRHRVGLGIETTTPGSLYDREGFLKEYPGRYP